MVVAGGAESGEQLKPTLSNTGNNADLSEKLKQETLPEVKTSTLTAQMSASNYDAIVTAASTDIYNLLSSIHDFSQSNFFSYAKSFPHEYENDKSLDFSKTQTEENIFHCTAGSSQGKAENFTKSGETQNGSKLTFTAANCVTEDAHQVTGSMSFTVADAAKKILNADYKFKYSEKATIVDLDGKDVSEWSEVVQGGLKHDKQTVAYDFKVSAGTTGHLKAATLQGKADLESLRINNEVRPRSLNIHQGSVQSVAGYGTVQLYTEAPLIFEQQGLNDVLQSGKLILKANNGQIVVAIVNGQAEVSATVGADKIADNVAKGNAADYLYP